jgi:hypothetical protein
VKVGKLMIYIMQRRMIMNKDNQKIFMDWLDTCPIVEYRSIENVEEDSATWIYTVDFAVVKENE